MEFMREFPDDAACLEHLWRSRYSEDGEHADCPKCERERVFKKYATKQGRQSWTCTGCGHHIHPTAGTIFAKSSTSLHLWYYAMYLMASTRCGISAKQLERELGVAYKMAWRMFNRIRNELMADEDGKALFGDVEVDETSMIFTDDWPAYKLLRGQFLDHKIINHSTGEYVIGDVHTNTIEGFFGNLKTGMRGTYKKVSRKWLQSYLDEYAYRYSHRNDTRAMFSGFLDKAAK
jgi:transposase